MPNNFDNAGSKLRYLTNNTVTPALIAKPINAKQKNILNLFIEGFV